MKGNWELLAVIIIVLALLVLLNDIMPAPCIGMGSDCGLDIKAEQQ